MQLTTQALAGLLAAVTLGCGSGNRFTGTVNGASLAPRGAGFGELYFAPGANSGQAVGHLAVNVTVSNDGAQTCPSTAAPGSALTQLFLLLQTRGTNGDFVTPGTGSYPVVAYADAATTGEPSFAVVVFEKSDVPTFGASGTVTLDSLQLKIGGTASGAFDVVMDASAGHISGTFDAENCVIAR